MLVQATIEDEIDAVIRRMNLAHGQCSSRATCWWANLPPEGRREYAENEVKNKRTGTKVT